MLVNGLMDYYAFIFIMVFIIFTCSKLFINNLKSIMKNYIHVSKLFIFAVILTFVFNFNQSFASGDDARDNSQSWFIYKKITNEIWQINDHGLDNVYIIIGKDSVLLIDTGMGVSDLKGYITSLVKLPIIVVNTHGHSDHAGGNNQFDKVYAHPDDFEMIRQPRDPEGAERFFRHFLSPDEPLPSLLEFTKQAELIPIKDGHIFDLGDRKVEVIEVPGHTKGSICLLDKKTGTLITGDNNNSQTWLFLRDCTPLETYLKSLDKLIERKKDFTLVLPGHGDPYDTELIVEHQICVNNILSGNCEPTDITTFAGSGKLCVYKRANVIFNPNNLVEKK